MEKWRGEQSRAVISVIEATLASIGTLVIF
jgi:hypothetical protein